MVRTFFIAAGTALWLTACGGSSGDFADLRSYRDDSPYRDNLRNCVSAETVEESCDLDTLPLLGMTSPQPSVDAIMDRVVVSHDWMGERMQETLNALPEDMLPIFRAVTAIVIDDDIRPAYYTSATGAIYLDPAYLWLTPAEASTINPKEDSRASFDDPLAFRSLGRYVRNNRTAYSFGSISEPVPRELDDILLSISRLLLHELAHANDYFPQNQLSAIDTSNKPAEAATALRGLRISDRLSASEPLGSELLFSLAGVMYLGNDPSIEDLTATGEMVGAAFEPDGASDDYGYSSIREDTAMLFEEAMMRYFFELDRDIAFTSAPNEGEEAFCSSYTVEWGVRNRLGDENVRHRAQFVVNEIFPTLQTDLFFQNYPFPESLDLGENWCESLVIDGTSSTVSKTAKTVKIDPRHLRDVHRHVH